MGWILVWIFFSAAVIAAAATVGVLVIALAPAHAASEVLMSLAAVHRRVLGAGARTNAGAAAVGAIHVGCGVAALSGYPGALAWSAAIAAPDLAQHLVLFVLDRSAAAAVHLITAVLLALPLAAWWWYEEPAASWWLVIPSAAFALMLALLYSRGRRSR